MLRARRKGLLALGKKIEKKYPIPCNLFENLSFYKKWQSFN